LLLMFLHVYEGITCICRLMIESLMMDLCTSQQGEPRLRDQGRKGLCCI